MLRLSPSNCYISTKHPADSVRAYLRIPPPIKARWPRKIVTNRQTSSTSSFQYTSDSPATYGALQMCFDWLIDWLIGKRARERRSRPSSIQEEEEGGGGGEGGGEEEQEDDDDE